MQISPPHRQKVQHVLTTFCFASRAQFKLFGMYLRTELDGLRVAAPRLDIWTFEHIHLAPSMMGMKPINRPCWRRRNWLSCLNKYLMHLNKHSWIREFKCGLGIFTRRFFGQLAPYWPGQTVFRVMSYANIARIDLLTEGTNQMSVCLLKDSWLFEWRERGLFGLVFEINRRFVFGDKFSKLFLTIPCFKISSLHFIT